MLTSRPGDELLIHRVAVVGLLAESGEGDGAVGCPGLVVVAVVGSVVVPGAEEGAVGEVGGAALGPGVLVVGFAPCGGDGAAACLALVVGQAHRDALGAGEESLVAAQVEDLPVTVEDGGQEAVLAGQAADCRVRVSRGGDQGGHRAR